MFGNVSILTMFTNTNIRDIAKINTRVDIIHANQTQPHRKRTWRTEHLYMQVPQVLREMGQQGGQGCGIAVLGVLHMLFGLVPDFCR